MSADAHNDDDRAARSWLELGRSLLGAAAGWAFMGLVALPIAVAALLVFPSRRARVTLFNVFGRVAGRAMLWCLGASVPPDVRVRMDAVRPAIFVSNHASYLDNFLLVWALPLGTLGTARRSTVWVPYFGQLYALCGHVLVDRADRRDAVAALRELIALVTRFRFSAILWPEGTRSRDGRLQPFKRGFVHLALATRLPVVPVVVSGSHRCWPRGAVLTRPARVHVRVLAPIATTAWTARTIDRHVAEVWEAFATALPPEQQPVAETIRTARGATSESRR